MSNAKTDTGRTAHAAESDRVRTIETAIRAWPRATGVDFEAAREHELERVVTTEPSALALERERRRTLQAR